MLLEPLDQRVRGAHLGRQGLAVLPAVLRVS